MAESVAAQSQYRLGEKHRAWMVSFASRLYSFLPSAKSQSIAVPSCSNGMHTVQKKTLGQQDISEVKTRPSEI